MPRRFFLVPLLVCLSLAFVPAARGADTGAPAGRSPAAPGAAPGKARVIRGQVFNGTLNRPASSGVEVRLIAIDGRNIRSLGVTKTDASGRFSFPGVKAPSAGKGHLLTVTQYKGAPYMALAPTDGKEGRLLVFELTRDPKGIRVESHQVLVRFEEDRLVFRETLRLVNSGKATYRSGNGETLAFTLPPGAELLQPPAGLNPKEVRMRPGLVTSSEPLPPGFRQVDLMYAIPNPPAQVSVETRFQFPTRRFDVMTPEFGMREPLSADLRYEGVFGEDRGNRFHLATKSDVPAGTGVKFTLSRDVKSSFAETLFFVIAGVVIAGLSVPFVLRRRRLAREGAAVKGRPGTRKRAGGAARAARPPKASKRASPSKSPSKRKAARPSTPGGKGPDLAEKRKGILVKIAALDDDWEAGKVSREDYERRREELKRRALAISKKIGAK